MQLRLLNEFSWGNSEFLSQRGAGAITIILFDSRTGTGPRTMATKKTKKQTRVATGPSG